MHKQAEYAAAETETDLQVTFLLICLKYAIISEY